MTDRKHNAGSPAATGRVPITKTDVRKAASMLDRMAKLAVLELSGKTGDEIYELCFARLLKPDPAELVAQRNNRPPGGVLMMGTDQRDLFVPLLRREARYLKADAAVADLGCGDGQTSRLLWEKITTDISLSYLDPSQHYLEAYRELAANHAHITAAKPTRGTLDDWIKRPARSRDPKHAGEFSLVLLIHALYFADDLNALLTRALEDLTPSGRLFLVFADELNGFTGKAVLQHLSARDKKAAAAYVKRIRERHAFFGIARDPDGDVELRIERLRKNLGRPDVELVHFEYQPSRIYGNSLMDLYAAAFITGLSNLGSRAVGDQVGDVGALFKTDPQSVDLAIETKGVRARMLSVSQPQCVVVLRKSANATSAS